MPMETRGGAASKRPDRSGRLTASLAAAAAAPDAAVDDPLFFLEYTGLSKLMVCRDLCQNFLYNTANTLDEKEKRGWFLIKLLLFGGGFMAKVTVVVN